LWLCLIYVFATFYTIKIVFLTSSSLSDVSESESSFMDVADA